MNRDQVKGRFNKTLGNLKEIVGKITDNKCLEIKGGAQKNAGKGQAEFGDLKNNLKKWKLKRI